MLDKVKSLGSFLLLLIFLFCFTMQQELNQMDSVYTIDLDGNKETSIPLSTYFKNAQSIILETNKDCLIGFINDFQVFDNCIYVLDILYANSLYVFDMNGRFLRKIGSTGNGPGEYIRVEDFTLDIENQFIYLLDYGRRIHKYDLNGKFVSTITPQVTRSNIKYIQYYKNKLYICSINKIMLYAYS